MSKLGKFCEKLEVGGWLDGYWCPCDCSLICPRKGGRKCCKWSSDMKNPERFIRKCWKKVLKRLRAR